MRSGLIYALLGVAGFFAGTLVDSNSKFQAGRMDACQNMLALMVLMSPALGAAQPQCVPYKGVTAIRVGTKFYSLDGKAELN